MVDCRLDSKGDSSICCCLWKIMVIWFEWKWKMKDALDNSYCDGLCKSCMLRHSFFATRHHSVPLFYSAYYFGSTLLPNDLDVASWLSCAKNSILSFTLLFLCLSLCRAPSLIPTLLLCSYSIRVPTSIALPIRRWAIGRWRRWLRWRWRMTTTACCLLSAVVVVVAVGWWVG